MVDDGMIMCSFEEPAVVTIAQRVGSDDTLLVWGSWGGNRAVSDHGEFSPSGCSILVFG